MSAGHITGTIALPSRTTSCARTFESDGVELWVLFHGDEAAGFFELQRHADGSVEIVYFGLTSAFFGKGLGKHLLTKAAESAWALGATRVWLHTCTLDSPAALPNYLARGFSPYRTETYEAIALPTRRPPNVDANAGCRAPIGRGDGDRCHDRRRAHRRDGWAAPRVARRRHHRSARLAPTTAITSLAARFRRTSPASSRTRRSSRGSISLGRSSSTTSLGDHGRSSISCSSSSVVARTAPRGPRSTVKRIGRSSVGSSSSDSVRASFSGSRNRATPKERPSTSSTS